MAATPAAIGTNCDMRVSAADPGVPSALVIATARANVPLLGGVVLVGGSVLAVLSGTTDRLGISALSLWIPGDPTLRGVQIVAQGASVSLSNTVQMSNGLALTLR